MLSRVRESTVKPSISKLPIPDFDEMIQNRDYAGAQTLLEVKRGSFNCFKFYTYLACDILKS